MLKKQCLFIVSLFVSWLLFMAIQKPVFIGYHHNLADGISMSEYLQVILNGLKLDLSVAGYLTAIPLLTALLGTWYNPAYLRTVLKVYFWVATLVVALIFVIDIELYSYWQFRLDTTVLFYMQSPTNAMASVPVSLFIRQCLLMVVYMSIMYQFLVRLVLPLYPAGQTRVTTKKLSGSLALVLMGGLIFIAIRGGVTTSTANVGKVYFSQNQFLNHAAINPCFSLLASLSKSEDFGSQFNFYPEEERMTRFGELFPAPEAADTDTLLLNTTRPNVLFILLESFSTNVIGSLGGIPDITPNLDKLSEEGILFTNCYSSSFRTDRGLVATLSGYPGQPTTSIMKMPAKSQTLPSIAKSLKNEGYETDVLYGGDINFTNMKSYFISTGYGKLFSDIDFPLNQRLNKWGAQDDVTFNHLYEVLEKRNNQQTPWHTMYLTLSTHNPFEVPYHKYEHPYLNTMSYADSCLGVFIDKLKQQPVWDNTLIILIADHGYRYPETFQEHEPPRFHVPMLWLGGAVKEARKIDKLVSQTDIVAILLGQMKLPHNEFTFSRDVFNPAYKEPFVFYTYNNGFAVIDSTGTSLYDNEGKRTVYQVPEANNEERLDKGRVILQTLYDDLGKR